MKDLNNKKIIIIISSIIALIILISISNNILETNTAGYFQVKQAAITGEMTVRLNPGVYFQGFGDIYTYKNVATVGFGSQKGEGSADIESIPVIFNDGSKANISGLVRVKLPSTIEGALILKKEYASGYEHFIRSGIVPIVQNAVKLSANLRSAQDAYTTLALFQQAIEDQLRNGIYVTKSDKVKITRATGDTEEQKVTVVVLDKDGMPKRLPNRLKELGCEVAECVIDVPAFDKKVEDMIAKRKDEAMKTELAKQEAIRAKQDAITSEEQGKANVAKAKYEKEVEKIKEVTTAQKEYEVEKLAAFKAIETAKKVRAEGMAKAAANEALVRAGLTPLERANIEKDTKIGVAAEIAKMKWPETIVIGGSGNGSSNPIEALGLNALYDLTEKMSKAKTTKTTE